MTKDKVIELQSDLAMFGLEQTVQLYWCDYELDDPELDVLVAEYKATHKNLLDALIERGVEYERD